MGRGHRAGGPAERGEQGAPPGDLCTQPPSYLDPHSGPMTKTQITLQ